MFEDFAFDLRISIPIVAHPMSALKELITVFCDYLDPAAKATFLAKTIGEFMKMDTDQILSSEFVRGFRDEGKMCLSGNYAITGRRKT